MSEYDLDNPDRMGIWEYLVVLRRRWRLVVCAVVLSTAGALGYSVLQTPEYVAGAEILVGPTDADATLSANGRNLSDEIATQVHVVSSLPVARLVQQRWSLARPPDLRRLVSVQAVGTGRILRVTARDRDPAQAATTANTVAAAYLQFRQADALNSYQQALDRVDKQEADIKAQLSRIDALLARETVAANKLNLQTQRRSLLADLAQLATQRDTLSDSLSTVTSGGELLREAGKPGRPASPRTTLNGVLGGIFGLLLGCGAALLRERFDDGVHGEAELRQALGDPLVLGRIPRWEEQSRSRRPALAEAMSAASEEYQRLAVNLRFMLAPFRVERGPGAVVLVTSAQQGEGTTSTACNLAVAGTRLGLRMVLVDADLRHPEVGPRFGLADAPGLSDLLAGTARPEECVVDVDVAGLGVLPAGTIPPNPAALLGSGAMPVALGSIAGMADVVLIDSPSVLVGADTLQLANHADMVMVVARQGVSRRRQLVAVMESLRQVAVTTIGVVYNDLPDAGRHRRRHDRRTSPFRGGRDSISPAVPEPAAEPERELHGVRALTRSVAEDEDVGWERASRRP